MKDIKEMKSCLVNHGIFKSEKSSTIQGEKQSMNQFFFFTYLDHFCIRDLKLYTLKC